MDEDEEAGRAVAGRRIKQSSTKKSTKAEREPSSEAVAKGSRKRAFPEEMAEVEAEEETADWRRVE